MFAVYAPASILIAPTWLFHLGSLRFHNFLLLPMRCEQTSLSNFYRSFQNLLARGKEAVGVQVAPFPPPHVLPDLLAQLLRHNSLQLVA